MKSWNLLFLLASVCIGIAYSAVDTSFTQRVANVEGKEYHFNLIKVKYSSGATVKATVKSDAKNPMLAPIYGNATEFSVNELNYIQSFGNLMGIGPIKAGFNCGDGDQFPAGPGGGRRLLLESRKLEEGGGPPNPFVLVSRKSDPVSAMFEVFANQEAIQKSLFSGGGGDGGGPQYCAGFEPEENPDNKSSKDFTVKLPGEAAADTITLIAFSHVYDPIKKNTQVVGPSVNDWTSGKCKILVRTNDDYTGTFDDVTSTVTKEEQLGCDYAEFAKVSTGLSTLINDTTSLWTYMTAEKKAGNNPLIRINDAAFQFNKLEGTDAFAGCFKLLKDAAKFADNKTSTTIPNSKDCTAEEGSDAWKADPCCNYELQQTQCCIPRDVVYSSYAIIGAKQEALKTCGKGTSDTLTKTLQIDQAMQAASAWYEQDAKDNDLALKNYANEQNKMKGLYDSAYKCWDRTFGSRLGNTMVAANKNEKNQGSQKYWQCTSNNDCYSNTCKKDSNGGSTKSCQALTGDEGTKALIGCVFEEVKNVQSFIDVMNAYTEKNQCNKNVSQWVETLKDDIYEKTCVGESSWRFVKNGWNPDQNCMIGKLDEAGCLGEKKCNIDPWQLDTEAKCTDTSNPSMTYDKKSCMSCYGGENGYCYPETKKSICRIDNIYDESTCIAMGASFKFSGWSCIDTSKTTQLACSGNCPSLNPVLRKTCVKYMDDKATCQAFTKLYGNIYKDFHFLKLDLYGKKNRCEMHYAYNTSNFNEPVNVVNDQSVCETGFTLQEDPWSNGETFCDRSGPFCVSKVQTTASACTGPNYWQETLNNGAGACINQNFESCKTDTTNYDAYDKGRWEEGRFDTKTACDDGRCSMGPEGISKTECEALPGSCNRNCATCVSDEFWTDPKCVGDSNWNQTKCNADADCTWDSASSTAHFDLKNCGTKQNTEIVSCQDYTYAGGCTGTYSSFLKCRKEKYGPCKDEAACTSNGDCDDWYLETYDEPNGQMVDGACIVKYKYDEWGNAQCEFDKDGKPFDYSSGNQPDFEWTPVGCKARYALTSSACDDVKVKLGSGTWKLRAKDKATCESVKGCCVENEWGYCEPRPEFTEAECTKCGSLNTLHTWTPYEWNKAKLEKLYWKDITFGAINEVKVAPAQWDFQDLIQSLNSAANGWSAVIQKRKAVVNLRKRLEVISCFCGNNAGSCTLDPAKPVIADNIEPSPCAGESKAQTSTSGGAIIAGGTFTSGAENVQTNQQTVAPFVNTNPATTRRLSGGRNLAASDKLYSAKCMTVVKNSGGKYVGQLIGGCTSLSAKTDAGAKVSASQPFELCINFNLGIEVSDKFTEYNFGKLITATKTVVASDVTLKTYKNNQKICAMVNDSDFYCATKVQSDWKTATADAPNGCAKLQTVVAEAKVAQAGSNPTNPSDGPTKPSSDTDSNGASIIGVSFATLITMIASMLFM